MGQLRSGSPVRTLRWLGKEGVGGPQGVQLAGHSAVTKLKKTACLWSGCLVWYLQAPAALPTSRPRGRVWVALVEHVSQSFPYK